MRLTVDGRSVYAYTGGRTFTPGQPAVVFVHGAANDHSVFALQSRYFAYHGRNVLAVDLPGHGRSAGPALPGIEVLADWLHAAIAAAGFERAALAGHSMGALVALEHAARYPAQARKLVLLGPAVPMLVSDALLDAAARDDHLAYELITGWSYGPGTQLGGNRQPGVWLAGQTLRLMERSAAGVLHTDLVACKDYVNGLAAAARVGCPSLLVLGAQDQMAPARDAGPLTAALADVRSIVLPKTGHTMMTERPDEVLDALRAFV
jgi:pimeloyl-ACP methyl ester carboxylesterase